MKHNGKRDKINWCCKGNEKPEWIDGVNQNQVFVCFQGKILKKNGFEQFNWVFRARKFRGDKPTREGEKRKVGEVVRIVNDQDIANFDPGLPGLGK